MMLRDALKNHTGEHVECGAHCWAIDVNADAQQELRVHPHAAEHIFTDIRDFWDPDVKRALETMKIMVKGSPFTNLPQWFGRGDQ